MIYTEASFSLISFVQIASRMRRLKGAHTIYAFEKIIRTRFQFFVYRNCHFNSRKNNIISNTHVIVFFFFLYFFFFFIQARGKRRRKRKPGQRSRDLSGVLFLKMNLLPSIYLSCRSFFSFSLAFSLRGHLNTHEPLQEDQKIRNLLRTVTISLRLSYKLSLSIRIAPARRFS